MTAVHYDEISREWVRAGELSDQQRSTYVEFNRVLEGGDLKAASELAELTIKESAETFELYNAWVPQLIEEIEKGVLSADALDAELARITTLPTLHDLPDRDFAQHRQRFEAKAKAAAKSCLNGNAVVARRELEEARQIWLKVHDQMHDWIGELIGIYAARNGERAIKELWDRLMADFYTAYQAYDVAKRAWEVSYQVLVDTTINACRGHLSGPERKGDCKIDEYDDRLVLTFSPCGSGGRTYLGDENTGTGPRLAPPYGHKVTTEKHDWAWNKKGVCLYCAHCCLFAERVPMQMYGYPTRMIDPPVWNGDETGQVCSWTIYKRLEDIPEHAYARVGLKKPDVPGEPAKPLDP